MRRIIAAVRGPRQLLERGPKKLTSMAGKLLHVIIIRLLVDVACVERIVEVCTQAIHK